MLRPVYRSPWSRFLRCRTLLCRFNWISKAENHSVSSFQSRIHVHHCRFKSCKTNISEKGQLLPSADALKLRRIIVQDFVRDWTSSVDHEEYLNDTDGVICSAQALETQPDFEIVAAVPLLTFGNRTIVITPEQARLCVRVDSRAHYIRHQT